MKRSLPLLLLALAPPVMFLAGTGQVWEDFFITFRHSLNLVGGHGLTYQAGERLQGFSSPLTALLGAACLRISGLDLERAILLARLAGALALAGGAVLLARSLRVAGAAGVGFVLPLSLFLLESKNVAFAANGMETPYALLLLAALQLEVARGPRSLRAGALGAGLMLTRPDAFVPMGGLVLGLLAFPDGPRRRLTRPLLQAAVIAFALYLPWLVFAWLYYGSPVPLPILAKAPAGGLAGGLELLAQAPQHAPRVLALLFAPAYAEAGGWPWALLLSLGLGACGCLAFLWPAAPRHARRLSVAALFTVVYLAAIPRLYPWYLPVATVLVLPALGGVFEAASRIGTRRLLRVPVSVVASLVLIAAAALLVDYGHLARVTTRLAEGQRREIGRFLSSRVGAAERVYLECPGYIGFYSGSRMLDWPGLVSPEVLAARRAGARSLAEAARTLRPEWLVLRPQEVAGFEALEPDWLARNYGIVGTFDVRSALRAALPDHPAVLYDGAFMVVRRRD
ncbi:MAG: hypothetical protein U0167_08355 [bacterium]